MECEHCKLVLKSKYILKTHLLNNKACLKLRGLEMKTKYTCKDCNLSFIGNINLNTHLEICKKKELSKNNEEQEKIIKEQEKIIKDQEKIIKDQEIQHKKEIEKIIKDQEIQHKKEIDYNEKIIKDQEIQHKKEILEIKDYNDKIIKNLQTQLDKMFSTIEKLIDKPNTTNVTNNNVRNIYSDKYFLEKLTPEEVKKKCQNYLTEQVFFGGQKGIAQMCTDHIIKTKDNKVLLACSDVSRKKFKYMDENGNIKEDYEARTFTEKVFEPIKKASQDVYENILLDIKDEQEREEIDYNRKSVLNDKTMKAIDCFSQIVNIDNPSCNSDFKNELAILNK